MKLLISLLLTLGIMGCKTIGEVRDLADKYGVTEDIKESFFEGVEDQLLLQLEEQGVDVEGKELKDLLPGKHKVNLYVGESFLTCFEYSLKTRSGKNYLTHEDLEEWQCLDGSVGVDLAKLPKVFGKSAEDILSVDGAVSYAKKLVLKALSLYLVGGAL